MRDNALIGKGVRGRDGTLGVFARYVAAGCDAAAGLDELHGAREVCRVARLGAQKPHQLLARCALEILERGHRGEGTLSLGDVGAEVLALGIGVAHKVQEVVLHLEDNARGRAHLNEAACARIVRPTGDGADEKRARGGVPRGLAVHHVEVVRARDIPARVAHPAKVEGLTLERVALHTGELVEHAQAPRGLESLIGEHDLKHTGKRKVARVDGDAGALAHVQARLAAAEFSLVGDVVVDERGALEKLDGNGGGEGARALAAHGFGPKQGEHGAHALAAGCGEALERLVEVAREVALLRQVGQGARHGLGKCLLHKWQLLGQVGNKACAICGAAWIFLCHGGPFF